MSKTGYVLCGGGRRLFIILLALAVLLPAVFALPAFNLTTTINQNTFYTMPLVPAINLDYTYATSDVGGPLQTQAIIDIIQGNTTETWWDTGYAYRTKITPSFTPQNNKTIDLIINTKALIDAGKLRSDCLDLRLVANHSSQLPYILRDCNTASTKLGVKSSDGDLINTWLYYGENSPGAIGEPVTEYKYYDTFADLSGWSIGPGSASIVSGAMESAAGNMTKANLTVAEISRNSRYGFTFQLTTGANMSAYLAHQNGISYASIALKAYAAQNKVEVCLEQSGAKSCSTYSATIGTSSHDVYFTIDTDGTTNIFIDDVKINTVPHFTPVSSAIPIFVMQGQVRIDDVSLLEYHSGSASLVFGTEQKHYRRYTANAVGGSYGFSMPTQGIDSGEFSVVTVASRAGYNDATSKHSFTTIYNKIRFDLDEKGLLDTFDGRYVVNVVGTVKVTNNNNVPINLDLSVNSPLLIEDTDGSRITNDKFVVTINQFSSVTIPYISTGIITIDPLKTANGVLATVLKQNIIPTYHTIGTTKFDVEDILFVPPKDTVAEISDAKKTFRYTVDGTFIFDKFSLLLVSKTASQEIVRKGDVIDISIKVSNYDPFSRDVDVVDTIPNDFVLYRNGQEVPDKRFLDWNFTMNKGTSRSLSYQLAYIGNATGHILMPKVNVTSGRLRQFSNQLSIVRRQDEPGKLFVTKIIEPWNGNDASAGEQMVHVTLSVANPTQEIYRELYVDDMPDTKDVVFTASTIPTFYKGRWTIDELLPGQVWSVSYMTNEHKHLTDPPALSSFVEDDVAYETDVIVNDHDAVGIYKVNYRGFSAGIAALVIILLDLGILGLYVFRNPIYDLEGRQIPLKKYAKETWDNFLNFRVRRAKREIFSELAKDKDKTTETLKALKQTSGSLLQGFRINAIRYYEERKMSEIGEFFERIFGSLAQWFRDLRSISGSDWKTIIVFIFSKPLIWIHNVWTYGLFWTATWFLDKNPNSKIGKILSYSAKVLNPNLKEYVYGKVDDAAARKQEMYKRQIKQIFRDKFKAYKKNEQDRKRVKFFSFTARIKAFFGDLFMRRR